jgi:hypothetical protein
MKSRYVKQESNEEYVLSNLQKMILRIICTTKDADYHSLQIETKRTRTTIVQSLNPLRKRHYVWIQKVEPNNTNSKLIFRPTDKGLFYTIAFLDVDSDKIREAYIRKEMMKEYDEYIKSIPNYYARKELLVRSAKMIMEYNMLDRNGMLIAKNIQEALNLGFKYSLLELAKDKNFELATVLGEDPIEGLRKICGPDEIEEIREFFLDLKNNIDSIIKGLSEKILE